MKVGDYVRTKNGRLYKIGDIGNFIYSEDDVIIQNIKKSSPDIIDLIEVGDYVNGEIVNEVWEKVVLIGQECVPIKPEDIKSIVTKEQFESMEYKVKE